MLKHLPSLHCDLTFSAVDHLEFVMMISMLRPGYSPPDRKALAGSLLNETTGALQDEMSKKLLGKDCSSIEDGWKQYS